MYCKICNYIAKSNCNYKIHLKTKKHNTLSEYYKSESLNNVNSINSINDENNMKTKPSKKIKTYNFVCQDCNSSYLYKRNLTRHQKLCNTNNIDNNTKYELEIQNLKNQLEIQKLKHELEMVKNNLNITTNNNNLNLNVNTVNNNIKVSKLQFLNLNFSNVIDIHTFTNNYKDKYGLTNDQTQTLLENYQNDGINSCISSLVYYLKKSAIKQYKELKGHDVAMNDVILPFILSDKSLREHFEKSVKGNWNKTTMVDNIKRIVSITNDQVFEHHKQHMMFNSSQRKRIINGILKESAYSILTHITNPDFYKVKNTNGDNDDEKNKDNLPIDSTPIQTNNIKYTIVVSDDEDDSSDDDCDYDYDSLSEDD
jgi:hypothetical protein